MANGTVKKGTITPLNQVSASAQFIPQHPHNDILLLCDHSESSLSDRPAATRTTRTKWALCSRTTREIMMLKNKTVLADGSQAPVTVRGTVPGCNYRDNSCLIIQ